MEFRILGALEVLDGDRALDLGGQQQRVLLVTLLLEANRAVTVDRLIDALWGASPPATAPKALQVHVSRLRKLLGRERLLTRTGAYELRVNPDELDLERFERLWGERRPEEALAQWRSSAVPELVYHPFLGGEIARLEERRLLCLEERIDHDLAHGRHEALVGELEALAREHPLREGLCARLMLALYRSNRQAEALQVFQDTRRRLIDELGIEPGRELRELQRRVLEQDPALEPGPATALPTGTVTVLFTDIEGSTRLAGALREQYAEVLETHRRTLRAAFSERGGVEVDTQGDAFLVAFARARDAVAAAVDAQRALAGGDGPARVRIGIHTGEPQLAAGGYYVGVDLSIGARICAAAHGGQILLSPSTRELAGEVSVADLGEHVLKDVTAPLRLYQVVAEGLQRSFPPLRAPAPGNLRRPAVSVYGRSEDVDAVADALRGDASLVTLTGPGGVGKTTVALEAAWVLREHFRDGIFLASLAGADPARLPAVLAESLEVEERAGDGLLEALGERLERRAVLLLLDDFDAIVASAPVLTALLERCPQLKILATSRERLHLRVECEHRLAPLAEPDAAAMFAARATAAGAAEDVVAGSAVVQAICRRLDGLPLAIELAAARARALPLAEILERLEQRLSFLSGGARDLPLRQQTLTATIDWSYDLLAPSEQGALQALAVFAGGIPLAGAEHVLGVPRGFETLLSLRDKSLLARDGSLASTRFSMLETIREYALERLAGTAEEETVRRRHARYFLELVERLQPELSGARQADALRELGREHENVTAALAFSAGADDAELTVAFCAALWRFWLLRGRLTEGRGWLARALADPGGPRPALGQALFGACALNAAAGEYEDAQRYGAERVAVTRALGDDAETASALGALANVSVHLGERGTAADLYEQAAAHARAADARPVLAAVVNNLGYLRLLTGDPEGACTACAEAASLFDELGRPADAAGARLNVATALVGLERLDEASSELGRALAEYVELEYDVGVSYCADVTAAVALRRGEPRRTAVLAAAAAGLRARSGVTPEPVEQALHEETVAAARAALDDAAFAGACHEGEALSLDELRATL